MPGRNDKPNVSGSRLANGLIITSAVLSVILVCVLVVLIITIVMKEDVNITPAEKTQSDSFTSGPVFVSRNGWTCMRVGSGITIYHEGNEKYKLTGKTDYNLLAADDGVYYTKDQDFYFCSYADGSETLLMESDETVHPIGLIGKKVFFTTESDDYMQFKILQYDTVTKESIRLDLPELWGDVEMIFCNDHFYYIGGRTDVSTRPLYEVDIEKGESLQIEPACGTGLLSSGSKIYYSRAEAAGSMTDSPMTITELDTDTGAKKDITSFTPDNMMKPIWADSNYVYLISHASRTSSILQFNISDGTKAIVIKGPGLSVIGESDNGFYYSSASVSDNVTLYEFNESVGSSSRLGTAKGAILGFADGYIYYGSYSQTAQAQEYYRTRL